MTTYEIITDDNFTRSSTSAGTVTGPGTYYLPSSGAAYVDKKGSTWLLNGTGLVSTGLSTQDYSNAFLLRPTSESILNGQITVTALPGNGPAMVAIARAQSGGLAYGAYFYNGIFTIVKLGPGAATQTLLTSVTPSPNGTLALIIVLTVQGVSPTTLTATLAYASAPATILYTLTTTDSTAALQMLGQWGVAANSSSGNAPTFSHLTIAQDTTLSIGTLQAAPTDTSVTLSLSSNLAGGSPAGYAYNIYRGTDPNFTPASGTLLTTVSSLPYVDTTAVAGTQYFYGVIGTDGVNFVSANPYNLGVWAPAYTPFVSAQLQTKALAIVFDGDSITQGYGVSNAGTMTLPTMPAYCVQKLKRLLGIRNITGSNLGDPGKTFAYFNPGGADYAGSISAMTTLLSATPTALPVFSTLLGTNDSQTLTASQYATAMATYISSRLAAFPTCKVVMHMPPYYSPNTHNSGTYEQTGLSRLFSYRAVTVTTIQSFAASNPGQVFLGDTYSFQYFAQNYYNELQPDTTGPNGIFYLHPQGTAGGNGLIGTQSLGEMHAEAIALAFYGTGSSGGSRSSSFY